MSAGSWWEKLGFFEEILHVLYNITGGGKRKTCVATETGYYSTQAFQKSHISTLTEGLKCFRPSYTSVPCVSLPEGASLHPVT